MMQECHYATLISRIIYASKDSSVIKYNVFNGTKMVDAEKEYEFVKTLIY